MKYHIEISNTNFLDACRVLRKLCHPSKGEEAILTYDSEDLHIHLGGMSVKLLAKGRWPAQVRVPGKLLMALVKHPIGDDPVCLVVNNERLSVNQFSIQCTVQEETGRPIKLPMNPSLVHLVWIGLHYSEEDIRASGYAGAVEIADEKAAEKISAAAERLNALNISEEELFDAVYSIIRKRSF